MSNCLLSTAQDCFKFNLCYGMLFRFNALHFSFMVNCSHLKCFRSFTGE